MAEQTAKYAKIIEMIKTKIEAGELPPGSKVYSENELVSIFCVSRQTVRHAISVLEEEGIVERRRGSGTYIKGGREEKKKRTMRIAIITTYVDEYIFPNMVTEMEHRLSKEGYTMQITFTHNAIEKERRILKTFLRENNIDGIIAETTKSGLPNPNLDLYRQLKKKGIKIVFINSFYPMLNIPHACMDDVMAGRMVTEHLLQCGHQRIGGIFKNDDDQGHQRYKGYIEALMEHGVTIRDERVAWIDTWDIKETIEYPGRILSRLKNCTACVCYNDEVALKLMGLCIGEGIKIPEELSIIGIDNSDLARFCEVPLTSANNPLKDVVEAAVTILLKLLNGNKDAKSIELEPVLVIRNSVKMITDISQT